MKLQPGAVAPDFTARDMDNREVSLATLRREGPMVLVFLRGFS